MREPIMRRGLSPEGQEIRARHQGSLIIGSSSVVPHPHTPLYKRPLDVGKPSVRGSVLQDSQANEPKGHPVKAKHAVVSDDYLQKRTTLSAVHAASSFSSKTLDRDGSAHSDYFSLSDEPHLEENSFSAQKKTSATFPGGSPKHSLVKTSLTSDLEEEVPKGRGRNHMSIKFDDRIGDDDVDYANSCPGLEGLEEKGEKNIIESVQGTNKENDNGSSKASSLLGETEKPSGPIYNSTDSLHSYQFNEQQNRSSELLSTYEVENKGLLAREESVRSRAQEIIEQNFNQRHMTQRYKNQHLSADNPLLVTEDYISDDGPCSRAKSLVPNLPKTEPFSIKSSSAPQHCFSNLNEDVSSHEVSALGNVISMPDRRSSSLSNVTYTKESIKEELKYPNIKPPSPISSQQEEQSSDLTQKQLAIGDTFTISSKQAVVSNSGNNTLGQTYSVTQNKNKGSNYNPNQPFCQTYTISKSASNSDNIVSHIDSEQNSSRDISLQNNFNSQPSQSLIKSRSLEFDSPKRNSASSSIHSGRITPEILEPAISYEMDKFSHRSASSQALSRAMEYSKESVLGRLQSGSTNKLMPVTLVKPSEFTRSLRNNTVQSNRRTVSRSSPVKASGAFSQKLDNRNDVPNSLSLANPLNLKNKKVSDVMSKIKMNKPTCDVNYRTVKKNIERQHINLYTKDSRPSSLVGTKSSCCSVDGDSISSRLGFASKRSTRARSVDRGSVKRAPSVARSTVSSILDPVKNLQQGSIEKNLQDGSHDSFASRIEKTSNPSEKKERNEFECPSSIPNVRLRNSRYANMLRSKSSIDITEEQNDITSHNSARQSVPPISLKEINQESVDGSQLVDSSLKNNFSYSNDASLENIKLPLRVSLDTSTVSTSMNTLEMNLQPDSKAEKNKLPSHSANIPSSSLADIAADMTLTNERSQEKSEDPLPQPCIANESPQSAIGSCPERDSLTGIEDKEYASSTPRINGCQNQFHPSSSESHSTAPSHDVADAHLVVGPSRARSFPQREGRLLNRRKGDCPKMLAKERTGDPPPTYKRGQVPQYLRERQEAERRQKAAEAAKDPLCPPNHTLLPEHQRLHTLQLLHNGIKEVLKEISSLPVAQDTMRLRRRKKELEDKLQQLEEGVNIFSQPKVFVLNDEEQ